MSKFLLITKINLLNFFNLQKVNNSKYKSVNKRNYFRLIILIAAFIYLAYYVYYLSYNLMEGLISLNRPNLLFGMLFLITSMFIITSNIFKIKGILFDFKDYDLLFSLPIKRNTILLSKLASLYILNLIYTILFMIPGYFAYTKFLEFSYPLLYFLLIFVIPIVPIVISIIIGIIISFITSKFINKKIGSYIVNISLIILFFFITFKFDGMSNIDMANYSSSSISNISNYYPLIDIFLRLINNFNIIDLLVFLIIPVVMLLIMIMILNILYDKIREGLIKNYTSDNYQISKYQNNKPIVSLYKKEMKRFLSNPLYPINTIFGCILLIVMILGIMIFNDNFIAKILNINELSDFLQKQILMIISIFCVVSSTTSCAISLEGKSLWIMRMLPIKGINILESKILVNLTFLIPTIIISASFFGIYLHLGLLDFILLYLIPFAYALFTSELGLLLNLLDHKFDYTNEIQVIKQTLPVFLTIIIGILFVIIPFTIEVLNTNNCIILFLTVFIVDIILFIVLKSYGVKKLNNLY